jgi:hypothetical protein
MTAKEHLLEHLKKAANYHMSSAETQIKLAKSHHNIAEVHTNQIIGEGHRSLSEFHGTIASHHNDHARHLLELHESLSAASDAQMFPSHSDATDHLRSSAGWSGFLKACGLEQR